MRKKLPTTPRNGWLTFRTRPVGPLRLYFTERGLTALEFAGEESSPSPEPDAPPPHLQPFIDAAKRELTAYFERRPHRFRRPHPGPPGHPFPTPGVAGTAPDSLGPDHFL